MLLNVLDFPDPGTALLCAQHGDRMYLPGGFTFEAPPDGWTLNKSLELFGDGPGDIYPTDNNITKYNGTIMTPTSAIAGPQDAFARDVISLLSPPLPGGVSFELPHVVIRDLRITR